MTKLRALLFPAAICLAGVAATSPHPDSAEGALRGGPEVAETVPDRPPLTIVVENRSYRDVIVFTLQSGIRVRLGRTAALSTEEYEASCQRFMDRRTDFFIRQLGSRTGRVLRGEPVGRCDQQIVVRVYPNGLEFATVFLR